MIRFICLNGFVALAGLLVSGSVFGATLQCEPYVRHRDHIHIDINSVITWGPTLMPANEAAHDTLAALGERGQICFKGQSIRLYGGGSLTMVYEVQRR